VFFCRQSKNISKMEEEVEGEEESITKYISRRELQNRRTNFTNFIKAL
jgi:hypothetical protein